MIIFIVLSVSADILPNKNTTRRRLYSKAKTNIANATMRKGSFKWFIYLSDIYIYIYPNVLVTRYNTIVSDSGASEGGGGEGYDIPH